MSSHFILTKPHLGAAYSSGNKMPLGKLDPRLGSVRLNSASGTGIRLYDKNYGSKFRDGSDGLTGYMHRRLVGIVPAVGADESGMQLVGFKVYYGSGQDTDGVAYLGGWCRWDFNDVRFGDASGTEYKIRRRNIVEGVSCDIDVLVPLNLNTAQNVYLYFGNETASAADDDTVFEAVIPNVVLAMPMDEGDVGYVAGFLNKKSLVVNAGVGCGTGYQLIIKVCKGTGTDGTTTYNGEIVPVVYLGTKVRDDFCDVRFKHATNHTSYLFKKTSYVSGSYAIFVVKVTETLDSNQTIEIVYNNATASIDYSSDSALEAVIPNVVGAWPMDEEDQEVDPIVIVSKENAMTYWDAETYGTEGTFGVDKVANPDGGIDVVAVEGGTKNAVGVQHFYTPTQDWSSRSVIRITLRGTNSGRPILIVAQTNGWSHEFVYQILDNFSDRRTVSIPYSAFSKAGDALWTSIKGFIIYRRVDAPGTAFTIERVVIDHGVPATDYSGNDNHGTATGTTVSTTSRYVDKNSRQFVRISDKIVIPFNSVLAPSGSFMVRLDLYPMLLATRQVLFSTLDNDTSTGGFALVQESDNRLEFWASNGSTFSETAVNYTVSLNTWYTLIAVYTSGSPSTVSLYLYNSSGTLLASNVNATCNTILPATGAEDVYVGMRGNSGYAPSSVCLANILLASGYSAGFVDGVNFPDPKLIAGKVLVRKYGSTLPTFGAWGAEESSTYDGTVTDYSGNGNNGTSTGTTIVDGKFAGKKARNFADNSSDKIASATFAYSNLAACTIFAFVKFSAKGTRYRTLFDSGWNTNGSMYLSLRDNGNALVGAIKNDVGASGIADAYLSPTLEQWYLAALVWDGTNSYSFLGETKSGAAPVSGVLTKTGITIGNRHNNIEAIGGALCCLVKTTTALSDATLALIRNNYPDATLEEGKVLVRKYATTTQPAWGTPQATETRQAYAVKELYPSQHDLGFTIDRAAKKMTKEYYVGNEAEESLEVVNHYNGEAGYWIRSVYGTGSYDVTLTEEEGRLKYDIVAGAASEVSAVHTFGSDINWSTKDFVILEVEGTNSGQTMRIAFKTSAYTATYVNAFTDNFVGRKTVVVPLAQFDPAIRAAFRYVYLTVIPTGTGTIYIRKLSVDVGVWAYLESSVPDILQTEGNTDSATFDLEKVNIYLWDTVLEKYVKVVYWDNYNWVWRSDLSKFLNGANFQAVYGEIQIYRSRNCAVLFIKGKCGETKGRKYDGMADLTIKYESRDTKYIVGYAIKMPPADGQASATTGGAQVKIKEEVYYV
jgi:hypothetical protein